MKKVLEAIQKGKKFLISSHINPEGDAIGSQIALMSLLRKLKKEAMIVNESAVPHMLKFMKRSEWILKEMPKDFGYDTIIVLDCPDMSRIGKVNEYIAKDKPIINIDHHISNMNFGTFNWVDSEISSIGEMIYELFRAFKVGIEQDDAMSLYVAIMTDTGSFRYSNTSAKTHRIAAELVDRGVKPYEIYTAIYETNSLEDTSLLGEALGTLKVSDNKKVAWMWITKEMIKRTKGSLEGTENIINFGRALEGVEVAVLFRETGTENKTKVSFRSKGKVDVNKLAAIFGGGGHMTASGCNVMGAREEVEKRVLEETIKSAEHLVT